MFDKIIFFDLMATAPKQHPRPEQFKQTTAALGITEKCVCGPQLRNPFERHYLEEAYSLEKPRVPTRQRRYSFEVSTSMVDEVLEVHISNMYLNVQKTKASS